MIDIFEVWQIVNGKKASTKKFIKGIAYSALVPQFEKNKKEEIWGW